jgi:hypothetical protein
MEDIHDSYGVNLVYFMLTSLILEKVASLFTFKPSLTPQLIGIEELLKYAKEVLTVINSHYCAYSSPVP